jgi:hypothetical protein
MVSEYVSGFLEKYAQGCNPNDLWFVIFDDSDKSDIGSWWYINYNKSNALSYTSGRPELLLVQGSDIAIDAKLRFRLKGCFKFADCARLISLVVSFTDQQDVPERLTGMFRHYFAVTEGDTSISCWVDGLRSAALAL